MKKMVEHVIPEVGDLIELIEMPDPDPVPVGTCGRVMEVGPKIGGHIQVRVQWEEPRSLMLCIPPDKIRVIGKEH